MDKGLTILEARNKLDAGEISALELTQSYLEKANAKNRELNAFISLREEEAIAEAKAADLRLKNGQKKSLFDGLPIALKDNLCLKGGKVTAGSKILADFVSPYSATVVKLLQAEGAIVLGKTNLDEFAMGSSTENSAFGPSKNPWDTSRVPGGSSGGSAVSVAADLALAALGSDTGGSIRQPASFCGIVGMKPTYGAVSRYGLLAMASSLDQIGPMTKTVADARVFLTAIAKKDRLDATSAGLKPEEPSLKGLKGVKVGVPKEYFGQGMAGAVKEKVEAAINKMAQAGAKVSEVSLPHTEYALSVYYIIMPAEVSSNLARYDGIRFGYSIEKDERVTAGSLHEVYTESRAKGFGAEAKRRIMLGSYVLSAGYYDAYYKKAQQVRTLIKRDFEKAFSDVDVLAAPVSPTVAFRFGEKVKDPLTMYMADINTVPVNLAGIPALSLPCGVVDGMPVGLQLIAPAFADFKLLDVAEATEKLISF